MIEDLKPLFGKLTNFAQSRIGFKYPPKLFLKQDIENSKSCLGRTAHYDPAEKAITIFTTGRHPKDILRSFAHELVHHAQNLRGDLTPEKCGSMGDKYAQENPHMRKMEKEAYLVGNMCFRDWEDNEKFNLQESKILKENKTMTTKITKESLKEMIRNILEEKGYSARRPNNEDAEQAMGLEEAGCKSSPHKRDEELEEKKLPPKKRGEDCCGIKDCGHKGDLEEELKNPDKADLDDNGKLSGYEKKRAKAIEKSMEDQKESKIQTPEQENALYESRFSKRNTNLFNKLLKEWNIVGEQEVAMSFPDDQLMSIEPEPSPDQGGSEDDFEDVTSPEELNQKAASQERNLRRAGFRSMEKLQTMVGADPTGVYDTQTMEKIMAFQRNLGLKGRDVDGIYGAGTRRAFKIKHPDKSKSDAAAQLQKRINRANYGVPVDGSVSDAEKTATDIDAASRKAKKAPLPGTLLGR